MNTDDYNNKINQFLSDTSKFKKLNKDPTDDLKRQLNSIIAKVNKIDTTKKVSRIEGYFEPGYLYGNPKIHKDVVDPPLRPIISQIGTVTYTLSKYLNNIIVKYMPKFHMVDSTYEFLSLLRGCQPNTGMLASLDVNSLFTNVPVNETIEIIIETIYNHSTLIAPHIPAQEMRELLLICTTRTPFRNIDGDIYVQCDGVSMGSPLGPTFANFYMCNLENTVFREHPSAKPPMYIRYVDDICLLVSDYRKLEEIKTLFEDNSVLSFSYEIETNKTIPFLDVLVDRSHVGTWRTSVYVKPTNNGDCLNYRSMCPERYKIGVIRALLHRGYHVSSDWDVFTDEIHRIKQLLTNNDYPMALIDETVNKFIESKITPKNIPGNESSNEVRLFFCNQMSTDYKLTERKLKKIIETNVSVVNDTDKLSLLIYYKGRKLRNLFINNKPKPPIPDVANSHHVVYQYNCNRDGCNATNEKYIGYTACSVWERFKMHTQSGSIKRHLKDKHNIAKIARKELVDDVTILKSCNNRRDLIYCEAIIIKDKRPSLNAQNEGCERLLKIFNH